jgi:hypothetical protein
MTLRFTLRRAGVASLLLMLVASTTVAADSNSKVTRFIDASIGIQVVPKNLSPSLASFTGANAVKELQGSSLERQSCNPQLNANDALHPVPCYFGDPHGVNTVVLYGDSNAGNWIPDLNPVMKQLKFRLAVFAYPGCATPFIPTTTGESGNYPIPFNGKVYGSLFQQCANWHASVGAAIQKLTPSAIIAVSGPWMYSGLAIDENAWVQGFVSAFQTMTKSHPETIRILLGTSPLMPNNSPDCLATNATTVQNCSASYTVGTGYYGGILARDVAIAKAVKAKLVPTTPFFCYKDHCSPIVNNYLVYVDHDHTTIAYSTYLQGLMYAALLPILH